MTEKISLNAMGVKTQQDFCNFFQKLAKEWTLEDYLRALWLLVQANKDTQISFALLAQLLAGAMDSSIAPFDRTWLRYENPPSELGQMQPIADDFGFLQKMLLYQIADLHQLKDEGVFEQPPHILWLGVAGGAQGVVPNICWCRPGVKLALFSLVTAPGRHSGAFGGAQGVAG